MLKLSNIFYVPGLTINFINTIRLYIKFDLSNNTFRLVYPVLTLANLSLSILVICFIYMQSLPLDSILSVLRRYSTLPLASLLCTLTFKTPLPVHSILLHSRDIQLPR